MCIRDRNKPNTNTSANAATAIFEVPDVTIVDCFADIDFLTKLRYLKVIEKRLIV